MQVSLQTPGDGAPLGKEMTVDEVYFEFRRQGLTDEKIADAIKAADEAAASK